MITYNNIVAGFKLFTDSHFFLKTFTHGTPDEIDLEKLELYPLLHLSYLGADYSEGIKTYNLECYILDGPPTDAAAQDAQQANSVTDSEMVAEDILADITIGGQIFDWETYRYQLNSSNTQPLERTGTNSLAGVLLSIGISVPYDSSSCNPPFLGRTPTGSNIPTSAGSISVLEFTGGETTTLSIPTGDVRQLPVAEVTSYSYILRNSSCFTIVSLLSRVEYSGLNSGAEVAMTYNVTIVADGPGIVAIGKTETGASTDIGHTEVFTEAGQVTINLSGKTPIAESSYFYQKLTYLTSTTGSITINSGRHTITQPG